MPIEPGGLVASIGSFLGDPLADPLVRRAAIEVALIGVAAGALGCWIVHYELSYAAESVAHCMLPGLVLAALAGVPLMLGGALGLLVGVAVIGLVARVPGRDTAVAIAVTTLFGLGALLALGAETPPNLRASLFGDVLAVSPDELAVAAGLVAVTVLALALAHPRLLATGFDAPAARAAGVRVGAVEALLLTLLAVAVLVAVQGLGNLLAVGALVGPAAVARNVWHRMAPMMAGAVVIAVMSGVIGLYVSYHLELAAGASIALATVVICLVAVAAGPLLERLRDRPAAAPTIAGVEAR
jgi:ABC-type Mn2+/Zn2+ transport system permease subunit